MEMATIWLREDREFNHLLFGVANHTGYPVIKIMQVTICKTLFNLFSAEVSLFGCVIM
jgi:hypothetical protein